jgi:imidazolonepropionase
MSRSGGRRRQRLVPRTHSVLIRNAAELLTCARNAPDLIGRSEGGTVLVHDGRISAVGSLENAVAETVVDARGKVVMPGFVDCHTHVVFGGSRVAEYAAGLVGQSPPEGAPVGILGTAAATQALNSDRLVTEAQPRVLEMLAHGTTTLESKSGYGLSAEAEIAILAANRLLEEHCPVTIASTYLGAHALPPNVGRDNYVNQVIATMTRVAAEDLADFCDVYCDDGYFTVEETRRILEAGCEHGLRPKLHLDAYSKTGAAAVACDLEAVSVDHLNYTTLKELEQLGAAGATAVVMPALELAVKHPRPVKPGMLFEAGIRVAIATDMSPACWVASMQLVVQLACLAGMSVAQALRAATFGAACALSLDDEVGSLEVGKRGDILVLDASRHEDIAYRIGHNAVACVVKDGQIVVDRR